MTLSLPTPIEWDRACAGDRLYLPSPTPTGIDNRLISGGGKPTTTGGAVEKGKLDCDGNGGKVGPNPGGGDSGALSDIASTGGGGGMRKTDDAGRRGNPFCDA